GARAPESRAPDRSVCRSEPTAGHQHYQGTPGAHDFCTVRGRPCRDSRYLIKIDLMMRTSLRGLCSVRVVRIMAAFVLALAGCSFVGGHYPDARPPSGRAQCLTVVIATRSRLGRALFRWPW